MYVTGEEKSFDKSETQWKKMLQSKSYIVLLKKSTQSI